MTRVEGAVAHLLSHGDWSYSRSSGPGGQRRDHVETRVELRISAAHLDGLPDGVREALITGFGLERGVMVLQCGTERSREQNRMILARRLRGRVAAALTPAPSPRRPTRPGRAAAERRLRAKKLRTAVKSGRARVYDHDR